MSQTETTIPPVLEDLLTASGPSGYEAAPAAVWRAAARNFGASVTGDALGSSSAVLGGRAAERRLAVVGHVDEIGLVVTYIDDEGYLWFRTIGGWDAQILTGQRVTLTTRDGSLQGVVGRKPIHLLREEERKKVPEVRDLHIDIGADGGEQARERVRVGDVAVIDVAPVSLLGDRVAARALDNRVGAYVALEAARLVSEAGGAEYAIAAVAAVQEEITMAGSRTSAFGLAPTVALAVDVTHATDAPGIEVKGSGSHELGSGVVITRGSIIHPLVFEMLYETATAESIPFTVEASGRATGTDADVIHLSRAGVPTGLVSVPLRYMHSPVEVVSLHDVAAAAQLIAAFARRLTADLDFTR